MKKVISLLLLLCMAVGMFGCGKAQKIDPNAIAGVTLGGETKYVLTVEELVNAIDPSGNSVVTLLKDVETKDTIKLPYSCTIDFAGHTIATDPKKGIGLIVEEAGSENGTTTVKNGVLNTYSECVRVKKGAVVIEGMEMNAAYGTCVTIADNQALVNRIDNSKLTSAKFNCVSWITAEMDYSECVLTITNSELIAYNPEGDMVFHKGGNAVAGLIDLGEGTNVYSFAEKVASKEMWFNGSGMAKTVTDVIVNGQTVSGITKWSEDTENQVIDVLMVGNSFCWYFVEELHGVANAAGVQINVNNLYEAGCLVQEHWDWLQADASKYEQFWITNDFGRFKHPENLSLKKALAYDDWDVITLQQHYGAGVTLVDAAYEKLVNADDLFKHFESTCPDAKLYWHNTWAYQVGFSEKIATTADQTLRQNNINMISQTVADRNGVDQIPGGQAWAIARRTVSDDLCKSDLYHDGDVGGGQYLNACIWFEVLTGKSCIGNTWRPTDYRLAEEKVIGLQKAAHQAVAEMYGEDYAK